MIKVFLKVFSKFSYLALAVIIAVVVFTLSIWLQNIPLIQFMFSSEFVPVSDKLAFLWSLYGSIATNFTFMSATYTIMIAILFGIQISLLVYYIKKMSRSFKNIKNLSATSIGGLVSGILGIGCAACGTFVLTSVLAVFGAAGVVAWLPFGGKEFGFLGVALLSFSIYMLLNKLSKPAVCVTC